MILTGPAIRAAVRAGQIEITPYDEARVGPGSYDLTLGESVRVYGRSYPLYDRGLRAKRLPLGKLPDARVLDLQDPIETKEFRMSLDGFLVEKGRIYLMSTRERICCHQHVPVLDGRSSLGRLGLCVHATAGYGEIGFDGQWTFEVWTVGQTVRVRPGQELGQMRFHVPYGEIQPYAGRYVGEQAVGPVAAAQPRK